MRIQILDKNLKQVKSIESDIGHSAFSTTFDDQGYSYVVGDGGIIKYDKDGKVKNYTQ
ncbi:MAG: hypothetical protein ACUVQ0_04760 [Thermoproteota archaeon]